MPSARYVRALAIDPANSQISYSGTDDGLYKSTNGGASWIAVNNGLSWVGGGLSQITLSLAIDPTNSQTIYAGTNGGGVFDPDHRRGTKKRLRSRLCLDACFRFYLTATRFSQTDNIV